MTTMMVMMTIMMRSMVEFSSDCRFAVSMGNTVVAHPRGAHGIGGPILAYPRLAHEISVVFLSDLTMYAVSENHMLDVNCPYTMENLIRTNG